MVLSNTLSRTSAIVFPELKILSVPKTYSMGRERNLRYSLLQSPFRLCIVSLFDGLKKFLVTHSHKILAIFCRLVIPKHVDSFLRPAHVSFGIPNNMFFLFSLNIKLLPMKICWLFIEKSLRYLCWTHIIRLGEPCKEKKKRKIQFDFSFFSFFRCVWTKQRFHLICCWKRLNLCSFFTLVLLCVREAVDVFLAEFFPSGQVPQHTQHNRLLQCTILKKWTLSGWFLEWRSFSFWIRNLLYFWTKCIDFWSLTWKGNKLYLHFFPFFVPNWLDLVESNKVESNLLEIFVN